METFKIIVILHLMVSTSAAAKLLDDCLADSECPEKSSCVHRGCDGLKCVCQDNYMPSADETRCVKIAEIRESCDVNSRCRGQSSRCNGNKCVCGPDHDEAVFKVTSTKTITYCQLKPFLGTKPLLLGQNCKNENTFCSDVLGKTFCNEGTCQCVRGYRTASLEEINTFPYQLLQCVPSNFKLYVSAPSNLCPFNSGRPSTSIPYSTSTSSPSVTKLSTSTPTMSLATPVSQSRTSEQQATSTTEQHFVQSSMYFGGISATSTSIRISQYPASTYTTHNFIHSSETSIHHSSSLAQQTSSVNEVVSTLLAQKTKSPSSSMAVSDTQLPMHVVSSSWKYNSLSSAQIYSCYSQSSCAFDGGHTDSTNVILSSTVSQSRTETILNSKTPALSISKQSSTTIKNSNVQSTMSNVIETAAPTITIPTVETSSTDFTTVSSVGIDSTTITTTQPYTDKTSIIDLTTDSPSPTTTNGNVIYKDGAICNNSSVCMDDGICELDKCGVRRCRCQKGYILDITKTMYRKLSNLGGQCEDNAMCIGPFTKCRGGICRCQDDYVKSSDGQWCTHKSSWFINFPLLGDTCSKFFSECFHASEQTCQNNKCQCRTGLRQANDEDIPIPSDLYYQCRNASLGIGGREPRDCQGGPETFPVDPYYNAALKRIRKMQGIILGSIAGVVVVICLIIAGICYYRHKNRSMVQDMTSDKGSVVSFDRQSSGKYSFKIPRPFMPIIKDWDTDQMSYANSTFTADVNDLPKGDQTLRSSRSIPFPDQSEPEGYNRPSERKASISTASTVDIETSSTGDFDVRHVDDADRTRTYQLNHINLESGEG